MHRSLRKVYCNIYIFHYCYVYFLIYNGYLDLYTYHIWCHTWWDSLRGNCIPVSFHLYLGYTKTQQILLLEKQFDPHMGMLCPHHRLQRTRNFGRECFGNTITELKWGALISDIRYFWRKIFTYIKHSRSNSVAYKYFFHFGSFIQLWNRLMSLILE